MIKHVYLGRFAPFHDGHKLLLTRLIEKFGIENCLILIGSTNVLNDRTPFSFIARRKMILKEFPGIKIMPVPDFNDDDVWLSEVEKLQNSLGARLIFYGGSLEDLKILSKKFETVVLIDRFTEGKNISATKIRQKMRKDGIL